ncbi:MAG TPA: alpha/beta hydrolase fold domain-containing protein [Mycobacteriales bacterium]|nr:alpha/beta hydrolase fold domain-containing protein [Mycobacteriales bacterium]
MRIPLPVVRAVVRAGSRPMGRPVPIGVQRAWLEAQSRLSRLPAGTTVERVVLGGRPAERVIGPVPDPSRSVLLVHGGAFITCSPRTHRVVAAHLAHAAQAAVLVPDYRRAPEHPFPAAVDDADAALDELQGTGAVSVFGDSAGGAIALLLALRRRDEGRPAPDALALVSPMTDLTLASADACQGPDPLLRRSWVRQGRDAFLAGADPRAASPLHRDLRGLPPVLLHVSEHERLRPEGEQLAVALRSAGVDVTVELLDGLWHDVHVHAHLVPEAAQALERMGTWLRQGAST